MIPPPLPFSQSSMCPPSTGVVEGREDVTALVVNDVVPRRRRGFIEYEKKLH